MNKTINYLKPYFIAIIIFIIASLFYFSPVLEGKKIQQSDITQFIGSSKEIVDHRKEHDEEPYWTNSSFGGMPSYTVSAYYPNDYIKQLDKVLRFLPRPADYLFLYFLGFFILLTVLKIDWKLAILGSLGFGFSTYLIIILGVGHNAKAHAIAYMPMVLAGILLVFQKKYLKGFVLSSLAIALEISANHIQMTYYLMFFCVFLGIVYLIECLKNKEINHFIKSVGILAIASFLALGINSTNLLAIKEYANESTRGNSELTIDSDGKELEVINGLSKSYITQYSYGLSETFNLFIPNFKGGTSHEELDDSQLVSFLQDEMQKGRNENELNYIFQISSMYWGEQPIVAAPAYIGAIFIFLFVLALFLVKGKFKKWLVAATVFSILLSWGKNFPVLTNFFIDNVPLYNKFRAVTSIQVIAEIAIPLLGILGIKEIFDKKVQKEAKLKALKWSLLIVGGLAFIFTIGGSELFTFQTEIDTQIDKQLPGYLDAIVSDRSKLFLNDSFRSLLLVIISSAVIWLFIKQKIKQLVLLVVIGILIIYDLTNVDRRYVNNESFTVARNVDKPFKASSFDKEILQDKSHYRTADLTTNMMNTGRTSYFHKSIGGYSAAKLGRYQELYDFYISKNNVGVFNMLNTKYFIFEDSNQRKIIQQNPEANGNVWFVNNIKIVNSANEEILALDSLNTKTEAVIDSKSISSGFVQNYPLDSTAVIKLTSYKANELKYEYSSSKDQFVVFSEIYYKNGWNAYIDGVLTPHYRVNYVLRGLPVEKGEHKIEFKFEPSVIKKGNIITLVSYGFFFLIPIGWFYFEKKKKKNKS